MKALEDANIIRIGVHGMGGVGKTTLVKEVARQAMKDTKIFDEVAIAEVTQKPDNRKIQDKIASDLGVEFEQHENEFDRARRLHQRLKKGKRRVLVILDNIWGKPDLEAIGIPFKDDGKEGALQKESSGVDKRAYKILLTSRCLDVLRNDMNVDKYFQLDTLSLKDAQILFWKRLDNYHPAKTLTDFRVGAEIVGKCAGLPLAIATIAKALKNKSMQAWEDALDKLTANTRIIQEMDKTVVSVIELSFNLLQSDEAKKLFLLCCLVDDGHGISNDYLLRYGMGWGLFEGVYTLEDGKKRLRELINHLKASCLLLEGYNNNWVKMHEFVQAVARSIASTSNLMFNIRHVPYLDKVLEEKISKNPTAISLPRGDICDLPERLGCPTLELFFLFMKSPSLQIPDTFFDGMDKLKVIDLDSINLLSLPSSFRYLTNLRTLCLDGCLLGDLSTIGELKNLEILSFSRSNIEQLPGEVGQLTRLQLLDLRECSSLKAIPANVISRLSRLEELYLDNSYVQWENVNNQHGSNANVAELTQLSRLTTLHICIPDAQLIPPDLFEQEFKRFRILIGDAWNWSHGIEASRTLKLKLNNRSYLEYMPIKRLLKRTEDLFLHEWNDNQNFLYEMGVEGFSILKYLHLQNSPELLYVVNSAKRIPCNAFPMLEVLSLTNLSNLVKICHGPLKEQSFNKLKTVKVSKCDGLKHLFSTSMAKSLLQLEDMEVTDCENLKVIFAEDDDEGYDHVENETHGEIKFAQVRSLILSGLPQFTSFSFNMKTLLATNTPSAEITAADDHEDYKSLFGRRVEFPCLENLKLSSINIEKLWSEQLLSKDSYCQTVKSLTLENCDGFKFLFLSSMIESFAQLQRLVLCDCKSMEWVLDAKGLAGEESISFPKLFFLTFKDLPKLKGFANGNIIEFPELNVLTIENCPNLGTFFSNCTYADMTATNEPEPAEQPLFRHKVASPALEELKSCCFQNLTILKINRCHNLRYLLPSCMVKCLGQLQELMVSECTSLQVVIFIEEQRMNERVEFPRLNFLRLEDLPSLNTFCNCTGNLIEFPLLSILFIDKCVRMETFTSNAISAIADVSEEKHHGNIQPLFDEKVSLLKLEKLIVWKMKNLRRIWDDNQPDSNSFSKLREVRVGKCNKLLNIFPSVMQGRLQSLEVLKVRRCGSVEEIFKLQALSGQNTNVIIATQLRVLELYRLPNLKYVCDIPNREGTRDDRHLSSDSFSKLREVSVAKCNKLLNIFPSVLQGRLQSLEVLKVRDCDSVEEIFKLQALAGRCTNIITAAQLRELKLCHLRNLKHVCNMHKEKVDAVLIFCQLTSLTLKNLPELRCFSSGIHISEWHMLKQLVVDECTKVETLASEFLSHGKNHNKSQPPLFLVDKVAFPRLEELKLSKLTELLYLWNENSQSSKVFEKLDTLKVSECNKLMKIVPSSVSFNNLTTLEVSKCDRVTNLVTFSTARSLKQLRRMDIDDCKRVDQIIAATDSENEEKDDMVFKELKYLGLKCLPSLRSFCLGTCTLEFPSLDQVIVRECSRMTSFSQGILSTPKLERVKLPEREDEEHWKGDLNTTIQQMFEEKSEQIGVIHHILRASLVLLCFYLILKACGTTVGV